jgi:serine/threonine protein kinase
MLYVQGTLKLADFGLSPLLQVSKQLTPNVVLLWYRAPELLLWKNHTKYTFGIDLWAVGCVFGEFLQGFPLLVGRDKVDQIQKMTSDE